jgi:diguanylate cyclase (GGDEF)-like protein/PAS domain S-box-containing protein/putative nucleotidyltransferase with HDIG domain
MRKAMEDKESTIEIVEPEEGSEDCNLLRRSDWKTAQVLLRSCLESPKDMIILAIDINYNYYYFNKAHRAAMKYAYGKDVAMGMNLLDCVTSATDRENAKKNYDMAMQGISHSTIQQYGDQAVSYYETFYNPIRDDDDKIIGATAFARNISDRVLAEKALLESRDELRRQNNLFNTLLDIMPVGVFMVDAPNGTPILANATAKELLGQGILPAATKQNLNEVYQAYRLNGEEHYPPEEMPVVRGMYGDVSHIDDMVVIRPDGTRRYLEIFGSPVKDSDQNIWASLVSFLDITERKAIELKLAKETKILEATLKSVGDGVIACDKSGLVTFLNPVAEKLTGWINEEATGKPIGDVFRIENEKEEAIGESIFHQILTHGTTMGLAEHTILVSADGTKRPIEDSAAPILLDKNEISGAVIVFSDSTEKQKRIDQIEYLSYHDHLTGLYNRRFFEEEIARLDTPRNLPITIIMGDVNGLKLINDSFGHDVGDELLIKTAEVIAKECRNDDIVARLGGDEFVILLPKTNDTEAAFLINRLQSGLNGHQIGPITLSVSFGYETKHNESEDINEILKRTEDHLYRHKLFESVSMRSKTVDLILGTLHEKNKREMLHSKRVSEIAEAIAESMGYDKDDVNQIRVAGVMHDIGKIGIDESILNNTSRLTEEEWEQMKRHSEIGYRILSSVNEFAELAEYVLEHQERWDGSGYPKGLKEHEISVPARIISIADAFDAMTTERTYKKTLTKEEAATELRQGAGTQFDPAIIELFLDQVLQKL